MPSNLFLILVIAFVVIVIAIAGLAIGWLIKGKTKIDPTEQPKDACNSNGPCCPCSKDIPK
ncbi:MAG: hypothetical protein H0V82_10820 [Candidatus Protochlamydia sp.]|nr:hypothetical protein [Candidatus Protochlamydia sp.]